MTLCETLTDQAVKIKTLDELERIVAEQKALGRTVVHCHGVFDLLHPGHIRHFQAAKKFGDILVVTLTQDRFVKKGPGRPVFNQRLRAESLAAIGCIDHVAINLWPDSVETIKKLKPDVYVKGSDYANRDDDVTGKIYDEEKAVLTVGGRMEFTNDISFSSTHLINNYFSVFSQEAERFLQVFRERYTADDIIGLLKAFRDKKILVIGDAIIDEYHYAVAIGKPSKSACVSAQFVREEKYSGGAMSIANHIGGFCDDVHLLTCLGKMDTQEKFIRQNLKPNVRAKFFYRPDAPTVVKRRFVNPFQHAKMFEVCYLCDDDLDGIIEEQISEYLGTIIGYYDLVVAADFGHGFIGSRLVETLCEGARYLAVNAQANSANLGFNIVTKYPKSHYVCIDEREIRLAEHSKHGSIKDMVYHIAGRMQAETISVTLGEEGALAYRAGNGFSTVPIFSDGVIDTVGAGDAFLAITSLTALAGQPTDVIGFIGNAVGALAVRIVGNKESIEPTALFKFIQTLLK